MRAGSRQQADRLAFDSPGGVHHLTGFSGPVTVFDVTQPGQITRTTLSTEARFTGETGHRYWAVGPQGYQSGRAEAAVLTPDLRATDNAAAYVAIGPSDLLAAVQPLLDWHTAHGLATMAVPVQAIYDQFGEGQTEAEAIRSFLQYATTHWATQPQYVLLVGDASYDPLRLYHSRRRPTACRRFLCRRSLAARLPAMWALHSWTMI